MPKGDGIYLNTEGRVCVNKLGVLPAQTYARYLMEEHLGRGLLKDEIVHHIDGDISNDSLDNLRVMFKSEHCAMHASKQDHSHMLGNTYHLNKPHSEETKRQMSLSRLGKPKSEETKHRISKAKTEYWKKWRLEHYGTNS
jgi:hypothetical protein